MLAYLAGTSTRRILLIRHGQTAKDKIKRYIGQTETRLNQHGKNQAHALAHYLANVPLERIICSDLHRSRQTAQILAKPHCLKIQENPDLRELYLGQWEGRSFADIQKNEPENFRLRGENLAEFRPPGGESFADLQARVVPIFTGLCSGTPKNIAIVAHAGVNRVVLCHFLGLALDKIFTLGQDYGSLSILEIKPGSNIKLKALNIVPTNHFS